MGKLIAADLFCGAGGTSSGLARACAELNISLDLLAINHWELAIKTHSLNHPTAKHLCENLDGVDPRKLITGKLNLLVASPECTHHSLARGGKPVNDQSRASAWHVVRWAEALQPDNILVENVKEFQTWGPLGSNGRPLKTRKGETFQAWCEAIRSLGYTLAYREFVAADYGDATTRVRLFVQARRGRRKISWPEPTHSFDGAPDLFNETMKRWTPARDIIDWSLKGRSILHRERPLAPKTMKRIEAGWKKFGGSKPKPFLVTFRNHAVPRSLDDPLPTITAGGQHVGICVPEPFIVEFYGTGTAHSLDQPLHTITTKDRFGLVDYDGDWTFRMLQPHELARAMSFGDSYQFAGKRAAIVKQIGNAVPVSLARALCREILRTDAAVMQLAA
jgi:DNA (cytosine-5)-methyltransferase 1